MVVFIFAFQVWQFILAVTSHKRRLLNSKTTKIMNLGWVFWEAILAAYNITLTHSHVVISNPKIRLGLARNRRGKVQGFQKASATQGLQDLSLQDKCPTFSSSALLIGVQVSPILPARRYLSLYIPRTPFSILHCRRRYISVDDNTVHDLSRKLPLQPTSTSSLVNPSRRTSNV
jgi:hypothetical protein